MKRILVVVDMQHDFVDGALGTREAQAIVDAVAERIEQARRDGEIIFFTLDTHGKDYLTSAEGRMLPVSHCIKGTPGHGLTGVLLAKTSGATLIEKPSFGSEKLACALARLAHESGCPDGQGMTIELCGVCTDICVVTNALLLKTKLPEAELIVSGHLCAGVTPEKHLAALEVMRSCQVDVRD